ncbi:BolA family transcriptional regulator [Massilia forsythiae]|uniref:BolA family transcriptional regulator n=1 Tax=Massilia forsythiae TaxID=2728020 RepID=A0A7Z2W095_9BURK|nr:BolA family protein [Massilia forsythiae]QJE02384.1 BolA family transcriptional regulator [Massilia forsythiae]
MNTAIAAAQDKSTRVERIRALLQAALAPAELAVDDESHLHAGHAGAASGGGHYRVRIVSERFQGLRLVMRHRLVYDAVQGMMHTDIHALAITALAPSELS